MDSRPSNDSPEPQHAHSRRAEAKLRRRHRILQATAVLPSTATILNGLSGFGAIHFATKLPLGDFGPKNMENMMIASGLIFLAMVFDMLDGRLARMTRRTSDFGAQLDSLCDAVSFGVAPAVLMLHTVVPILHDPQCIMGDNKFLERLLWCVAAIYMACAILRLARFNVENEPDESAHMSFKGLPSPGAAAAVASIVLLYSWLEKFLDRQWEFITAATVLSFITLATALLMVSRFRYPHVVNQYIRGKRSFGYLVGLMVVILAAFVYPLATAAVIAVGFALSGPISAIFRKWRPRKG